MHDPLIIYNSIIISVINKLRTTGSYEFPLQQHDEYVCSGVYVFVLKLTFLYWDTYCCAGVYFIVLVNILAQPMNMFVY